MNRGSAAYREAVDRVKISYFTEKLGLEINGVVHVGTADGYEMQWYNKMGIENLLGVEPLLSALDQFQKNYPEIDILWCALADCDGIADLNVQGEGSSLLAESNASFRDDQPIGKLLVKTRRADSLIKCKQFDPTLYDCLVMDVQGMELQALKGFGDELRHFRMLNIECSRMPIYHGGAPASEVVAYLAIMGFTQLTPIESHDDILFLATSEAEKLGIAASSPE